MTIIDLKTMRESLAPPSSVVCLGNFDGIHLGHAALVRETVEKAKSLSSPSSPVASGACFFKIAPSDYFAPASTPHLITFEQKLSILADMGIQFAFVTDFIQLRDRSPKDFVEQTIRKECRGIYAVCGFNFHFGKSAEGTAQTLMHLMRGNASVLDPVLFEGELISSSNIRKELSTGNVEKAHNMLGRPFALATPVLRGKALGRTLGIPTINQQFPENFAIPKNGIYVTRTRIDGMEYASVSNVGIRPSVDDGMHVNCETHVLNFDREIYGETVTVEFLKRLRGEIRFEDLNSLTAQIQKDIVQTTAYYKEAYSYEV